MHYSCKWIQFILLIQSFSLGFASSRIKFKGKFASVGELQHVVYIQINKLMFCTGAIINESWIISAAHCFFDNDKIAEPHDVEVTAGISDYFITTSQPKQESVAKDIIIHPKFWPERLSKYDIALIKLGDPFELDLNVFYVELDGEQWPSPDGTTPRSCAASGFGIIKMGQTKNTKLKIMEVEAMHGELACPCTKRYQWKRLVCLTASAQPILCAGDSGSVLVCNNKAVAVAHMSIDKKVCTVDRLLTEFEKCGHDDIVPMFMYLCPMNDWIRSYVPNVPPTPPSCRTRREECCMLCLLVCVLLSWM